MESVLKQSQELAEELIQIRRKLHQIPEFGLNLPNTQSFILSQLTGLGEILLGDQLSSIVLIIDSGKPGPTVLLRADMDGLQVQEETGLDFQSGNGLMHACGHDLHIAAAIGAARILASRKDSFQGKVAVWFQPGEEGHGGADLMIAEGGLVATGEIPIAAYGLHVFTSIPNGVFTSKADTLMASSGDILVNFQGQGGHGSMPWLSKDPITAMVETISGLQQMIAKQFNSLDPVIINVGWIRAGETATTNVIPESASFGATVRTFSKENFEKVREIVPKFVDSMASAHQVSASVEFSAASKVLINDKAAVLRVAELAAELFGAERFQEMSQPIAGGEDFSSILEKVPGAFIFLGACPKNDNPELVATNHSNRAVFDDSVIADGAALLASLALSHLG